MKYQAVLVFVAGLFVSTCTAQIIVSPDVDLWGGGVINPSGDVAVPILQYDPANGEMWIHTAGLNGVVDTVGQSEIGGDDVGVISMSVVSPPAISIAPEFDGFYDGCVWNNQYFNGMQQVFCVAQREWLTPTNGMHVWTFETGLTPADFGEAEMAVNFAVGQPGATIFGGVQFVPEPSGCLISLTLISGLLLIRRKFK